MFRNPFAADWKYTLKQLTPNDDISDNHSDIADIGSGWIAARVAFSPRWREKLCCPTCFAITGSPTTSSVLPVSDSGSSTTAPIVGSPTTSSVSLSQTQATSPRTRPAFRPVALLTANPLHILKRK